MRYSYSWTLDIYVLFITNGNDRKMVRKLKGSQNIVILLLLFFFFRFVRQLYFVVVSDSGTNADGKEENRTDADADADSSFTVSRPQTFPPIQLLLSLAPSSSSSDSSA